MVHVKKPPVSIESIDLTDTACFSIEFVVDYQI